MEQKQIRKAALLVEDDAIQQKVINHYLEQLNYQVEIEADGLAAIQKIHIKAYDLVLTDLRLPQRSGAEVIQAARQSKFNSNTCLILASAQISQSDFSTYLDLGADAVLIKPILPKDLAKVIKAVN